MRVRFAILILIGLLLAGCKDDSSMAGRAVLEVTDEIAIREDTFPISTFIDTCDYILSAPDSFLLGERQTDVYGTIKADILTQLACPVDYTYPEGTVVDSIRIFLYYNSWTGGDLSPLSINIYEMDRATLEYSPMPRYKTNEDVSRFCSLEDSTRILKQERIVVADRYKDSAYSASLDAYLPVISFTVDPNSAFFKRFASVQSYGSQEDFNQHVLKGLYITTDFGSATALHISLISMEVSYHFSYQRFDGVEVTETGEKGFYANSEVKQINRYVYEDRARLIAGLRQDTMYNYLVAPAGVYTYVDLPMQEMYNTIYHIDPASTDPEAALKQYNTYSAYVNLAQLKVMVNNDVFWVGKEKRNTSYAQPAQQVLLIKCGKNNERLHEFFENRELPADTVAVLSNLLSGVDALGNTTHYYSFDISTLLTDVLHTSPKHLDSDTIMRVALVPVSTIMSSNANGSTAVVSVKEEQTISATRLYSTKNPAAQTTLQVVSSLFYKDY